MALHGSCVALTHLPTPACHGFLATPKDMSKWGVLRGQEGPNCICDSPFSYKKSIVAQLHLLPLLSDPS